MSMPPSSSPTGCFHDGWPNTGPTCVCSPYGAINGAKTAQNVITSRIACADHGGGVAAQRRGGRLRAA